MKFAIIDTETTGLFRFKDERGVPVPADHPSQPRLAHLAIILVDEDLTEERSFDFYVKPDGWVMTAEAGAINGLTTEFLAENGAPKLSDCCAHFGIDHGAVHTAGGDARACLEVFRRLHADGALPEARVHYAKTPPLSDDRAPAPLAKSAAPASF